MTRKKLLQIAVAIGGLVPVGAGLTGILFGASMTGGDFGPIPLDSHFRYLSGLLLGIGLCFWGTIPDIQRKGMLFRTLTLIVVIGGCGRVVSLWVRGAPDSAMLFGLGMELVITPLLALWQYRISKTYH